MSSDLDEVRRRQKLADYYYDNYLKHFGNKDFSKASEFLWGTINNLVYCLGLLDGQKLSEHGKVVGYLKSLANVKQDPEMIDGIPAAESMHANFYHSFMTEDVFEHNRLRAEKLTTKLAMILLDRLDEIIKQI
ncbi:MAG: hypothetical protein HYU02_07140 [Thaumarchaeota archaeon]|nr:hypothetical protein [Nitrososphaerota archaeon]